MNLPLIVPPRKFVKADLEISNWDSIKIYFDDLTTRIINSKEDYLKWLSDKSELETVLSENLAWRYIRMTCDTENKSLTEAYTFFITEIQPQIAPYANELNKLFLSSPFLSELNDSNYDNAIKIAKRNIELYREENIPLIAEMQQLEQQYGTICGAMTIEHEGNELTLQQAAKHLKNKNREVRKTVYEKVATRRLNDKDTLDELFNKLIALRTQIARNAGFDNYRDFKFAELCRFDYTIDDCFQFHNAIQKSIMPLIEHFDIERKKILQYDKLKPYDMDVDIDGDTPLQPFADGKEMMEKAVKCFDAIDPFLGICMTQLQTLNRVDLDSRKGKAPGGYNYPLYETGVPFIFMNASGLLRDLVTIVHEGGHAVHSIVTHTLPQVDFKSFPSEVAELASMSMELISMEHWDNFFADASDLKRAKLQHLEDVLTVLPWIACVDKFQHWVYTNPAHTNDDRTKAWDDIFSSMSSTVVDWENLQHIKNYLWQKQLHIFEVPFYYIEYGMAQLGAIALWRNYKQNPKQAIEKYIAALQLGYTKNIAEIYKTAGAKFDFSESYIRELSDFVKGEISS